MSFHWASLAPAAAFPCLNRAASAAGLDPGVAARPAIVDGLGQALQAGAVQAATAVLSALVRCCVGSTSGTEPPPALAMRPGTLRALAAVAAGHTTQEAAYKLAPPLAAHVAKLLRAARTEACSALGAVVASPAAAPLLRPCFGELAAAALEPSTVSGSLAGIVAALGPDDGLEA